MVEGHILVEQAVAAGWTIEAQFVAPGGQPVAAPAGVVHLLAANVVERVASTEAPQPLLAVVRMQQRSVNDLAGASLVVVADRIADPGNLGTMLRSCEAAGASGVVLTQGSVDPYNPKVVRASAGALFHVPVVADAPIHQLSALGLPLVGTSSHKGVPYTESALRAPFALVMGSEAHGVDGQIPIDSWITIEHAGRSESLNVAMATTLVVFEALRQRTAG